MSSMLSEIFNIYKNSLKIDKYYFNNIFLFLIKLTKLSNMRLNKMVKRSLNQISRVKTKKIPMCESFYKDFLTSLLIYTRDIACEKQSIFDKILSNLNEKEESICKEDLDYITNLSSKLHLTKKALRFLMEKNCILFNLDYLAFLTFCYSYCAYFEEINRVVLDEIEWLEKKFVTEIDCL